MPKNVMLSIFILLTLSFSGQLYADKNPLRGTPFLENHGKTVSMPAEWIAQDVVHEKALQNADLAITLNQDTYPILSEEVKRYAQKNGLNIAIQSGTCGTSAGKLLHKTIESGGFCCPPGESDRLPGLEYHTIAISAVAVIVNAQNPLDNLTLEQTREIFRGKIRHWRDLNPQHALDEPISITARLHCKARPGHWTLLLAKQEYFSPTLKEVGVIPDLVATVARERNAISIETPIMVSEFSKLGTVKLLKIDGHSPTEVAYVASGKYPFYRTFSMTTWANGIGKREQTLKLLNHLRQYLEDNYQRYNMVPISMLKAAGWKFQGDELVGEPSGQPLPKYPPGS